MTTATTKLTEKEMATITKIGKSEFSDTLGDWIWSWSVCGDQSKAAVLGSLCKKGLVQQDGNRGDDACCRLTETGIEAFKAIKPPV